MISNIKKTKKHQFLKIHFEFALKLHIKTVGKQRALCLMLINTNKRQRCEISGGIFWVE